LLQRFASGHALACQLAATQAERRRWRLPAWQNCERDSAGRTDAASNPDEGVPVIMTLPEPPAVSDDRVALAHRTLSREQTQRNHPGSELSSAAGSAIKRITAGVKACRDRCR